ncbi:MAG TPA: serine/threonine protein kinase, partial [Anaerolineae bacterium]|nr:serine/threonine protein kinase [Anaerolineae bacterium]
MFVARPECVSDVTCILFKPTLHSGPAWTIIDPTRHEGWIMALKQDDTLLNGHYRILRLLGRGGFGFVYAAQDTLLEETVAIKELIPALIGDEIMLKRFLAEARATMRLTDRHIVRTYNVFEENHNYYIVMEYMAGGTLEERLREGGPLPMDDAVRMAIDVCAGLTCAHEEGVVHCDLKPANILFDVQGRAKVADFGIAHVSGEMLTRSWLTPAGFVAGTLPYMSPEQTDGVRDDPRIDIYALGAVLYRALTGRPYLPFNPQETPRAQAQNVDLIFRQSPLPPSHYNPRVPAWLDGVVLKALAKQPEQRYASADALRTALQRRQAPVEAMPPTRLVPEPPAPAPVPAQRTPPASPAAPP